LSEFGRNQLIDQQSLTEYLPPAESITSSGSKPSRADNAPADQILLAYAEDRGVEGAGWLVTADVIDVNALHQRRRRDARKV
jgi:hypothetical protein